MTFEEREAARRIGTVLSRGRPLPEVFTDSLSGELLLMRARHRLKQALGCSLERAEHIVTEMLEP